MNAETDEHRPVVFAVEDEPANLELLVRSLGRSLDVRPYLDPVAALADALRLRPVLVVTDFRMPGVDGIELLHRLREAGLHCAALLVTGYSDLDVVSRALEQKLIDRVVPKPFRPVELRTQVELAMGLHRLKVARPITKS